MWLDATVLNSTVIDHWVPPIHIVETLGYTTSVCQGKFKNMDYLPVSFQLKRPSCKKEYN